LNLSGEKLVSKFAFKCTCAATPGSLVKSMVASRVQGCEEAFKKMARKVWLYKLNPVRPIAETAWFQPLSL
jgi:hypothetical protein